MRAGAFLTLLTLTITALAQGQPWSSNRSPHDRHTFPEDKDFRIISRPSKKALGIEGASTEAGAKVVMSSQDPNDKSQIWRTDFLFGREYLVNVNSGLVLQLSDQSSHERKDSEGYRIDVYGPLVQVAINPNQHDAQQWSYSRPTISNQDGLYIGGFNGTPYGSDSVPSPQPQVTRHFDIWDIYLV